MNKNKTQCVSLFGICIVDLPKEQRTKSKRKKSKKTTKTSQLWVKKEIKTYRIKIERFKE